MLKVKQRIVITDCEIDEIKAGCEKETIPVDQGKKMHDAFVMLVTVYSGKKNDVEGGLGIQSTLRLLPVNGTSSDDNA